MADRAGATSKRKFGTNAGVSTAQVDIRSEDADLTYQTAAVASEIVSSDDDDRGIADGTLTLLAVIATDVATVNGLVYTGVAGVKADNTEFSVDTSDTAAALDLAASITADTRTGITVPTATVYADSATTVVTVKVDGVIGNLVDTSSVDSTITAGAATLVDVDVAGAWSVFIEGLDADYNEISETIYLDGTTARATVNNYFRVNRAHVVLVGTTGWNEGTITIRKTAGPVTHLEIPTLLGESHESNFTVPFGKTLNLKQIDYAVGSAGGNAVVCTIDGWSRLPGESWRAFIAKVESNGADDVQFNHDEYEFPAGTDIRFTAIKLNGTGDAVVDIGYSYTLS